MVRLLVADAQYIVRMGVKHVCQELGDFAVVGEAATGEEALATLESEVVDMIVLEPGIRLHSQGRRSDAGGIEIIKTIRARHATLPILAFTSNNDPHVARTVLKQGGTGFLLKDSDRTTLVSAMLKVAAGEHFISPDVAVRMMFESRVDTDAVLRERLSARELAVLKMFAQGMSVSAIACELFINSRTVSTHKARLMQKMNFKNNAELVYYALESGLVDLKGRASRAAASS